MTIDVPSRIDRAQLTALGAAAILVPLNSTMIAVALPRIADDFDLSVGRTSIVVTAYLAVMLVGQPLSGGISDRLGAVLALRIALAVFLVSSLAAAFAPTFPTLVLARVGQAVAGSLLVPSVQSILRRQTPSDERGRMFGLLGSMLAAGAASGPVVGGGLIEAFGWQAIFLVNVPVVAVALGIRLEPILPAVMSGADRVSVWNGTFAAAFGVQALTTLGQYLLLLAAPVLLEARGWSSGSIGLGLSALTVGMIVMGPVGGRLGDVRGRRVPAVVGVAGATGALAVGAALGSSIGSTALVVVLLVYGTALGSAIANNTTAALESVDELRSGAAAGVLSMSRYVGSIGAAVLIGLALADDGGGTGLVLLVGAVGSAVAILLATRLPGRVRPELGA